MFSEIIVMSAQDCLNFVRQNKEKDNYIIISLQDTPYGFGYIFTKNDKCKAVITLYFDDIIKEEEGFVLFSKKQAKSIVKFVRDYEDAKTIIVHCKFGQSRSYGVGMAIQENYNNCKLTTTQAKYINEHVYNLLMNEFKFKVKWF